MIEKFFLGGLTPNGFSTQLTEIVSDKEYRAYILKGGPGTGKSSMMKKIAERFAGIENVTCYYCSSDPDSLDAVELHGSKVIVVDGTPPHVFEPRFPGVCHTIINLGQCWNTARLEENRGEIISASERNQLMMSSAANYNRTLGMICDGTYALAESFADRESIEEAARCLCDKLFDSRDNNENDRIRGKQIIRQLSVMTKNGYMTLSDTIKSYPKVYMLNDSMFAASDLFLEFVTEQATEHGYGVKLSPCLLFRHTVREHLLIDEIGTALITSNPLTKMTDKKTVHIDCSTFYDETLSQMHKRHSAANHKLIDAIAGMSQEMLENAKRVHDEMESYYISAMDFDALNTVYEKICDDILRREHQ